MRVVFKGILMDADVKISKAEQDFLDRMEKRGFLLTHFADRDENKEEGGSIESVNLKIKLPNKVKI